MIMTIYVTKMNNLLLETVRHVLPSFCIRFQGSSAATQSNRSQLTGPYRQTMIHSIITFENNLICDAESEIPMI